jgi:hypothetical protein
MTPHSAMSVRISPSARGFKTVKINESDGDLTFIVGSHHHFCPRFLAECISRRLSNPRREGPAINEVSISIDDKCFSSFLRSIGNGESLSISQGDRPKDLDVVCLFPKCENWRIRENGIEP